MKKITTILLLMVLLVGCTQSQETEPIEAPKQAVQTKEHDPYRIDYDTVSETDTTHDIKVIETTQTFNSQTLNRYMYTDKDNNDYPAGYPIVVKKDTALTLNVENQTQTDTNIHWHGLSLPNDQDGPALLINPQQTFQYQFTPDYQGTYWYHSHNRPVRDQVDFGMYGPLVILEPEDAKYTIDQILVIDDWAVNQVSGHMQIEGDTDTVNGKTGSEIEPISFNNTDLVKLRFIQAATAKSTVINFPFEVNVTHTDGMPLETPFKTTVLEIAPGERYDVELTHKGNTDETFAITNDRNQGFKIPLIYAANEDGNPHTITNQQPSLYQIDETAIPQQPNVSIRMGSTMSRGMGHEWTLNDEVFPNTESFNLQKDTVYRIRFTNENRMNNHPMHIHGAHFKILSVNGEAVEKTVWKDTVDVPAGSYIDVAIQFKNPGEWMLHCHILDHEDGGMMTSIIVE